jgi:shikimate dehydrogenase
VPLDGFADFVRDFAARGGKGCNVTVPFKLQAAELATSASERVRLAGAANTLVFGANGIHADNTDGLGIVADITRNAGVPIAGRDVLLLGAGGAAAGALGSLLSKSRAASSWSTALRPRPWRWSSSMRPLPHYISRAGST